MVLFAYLISHFLNHALGNISLDALADGVYYHTAFWQFPPVAIIFYAAALLHSGLGIWALYQRRQFRWKAIEPLQLVLGLSVPALVVVHIVGVRLGQTLFAHEKLYPQELYRVLGRSAEQDLADIRGPDDRLGAWLHRAVFLAAHEGMVQARRAVPARRRRAGADAGAARVLSGRPHRHRRAATSPGRRHNLGERQVGTPAEQDMLDDIVDYFLAGYLGLIGIVILARARARCSSAAAA